MNAPAYGMIDAALLTDAARRRFLKGGALMIGFAWLARGKAFAQASQGEEPSLRGLDPGSGSGFSGFQPGGFIRIARSNEITFIIPSTEMGQGIYTGEAMLLAEELEVGLDQIKVMAAPPNEKLYASPALKSQATGGSTSIRGSWTPLRQAGAAARTMLIGAAAARWSVPVSDCYADRATVHSRSTGQALSYGALVDAASHQPVPANVPLKPPGQWKLIGRNLPRVETPSKVNGTAQFGIDVVVPGMKFAAVAMCPVPGGTLAGVDDSKARALPGVVDVLKIADAVAVVADHYWTARKGVDLLAIQWAPGANADLSTQAIEAALADASATGKPVMAHSEGDVDGAMQRAGTRLDATYELPFLAHAAMEPINATVHVQGGGCEIWVSTQAPTRVQADVGQALGIAPDKVIIHNYLIGGGFGRRLIGDTVAQVALFAKQVSYPIKLIQTREQDIQHDRFRPAYRDRVAAGLDGNGLPIAWTHRVTGASVLGSYLPTGFPPGVLDSDAVEGAVETPYDLPTRRVDWVRHDPPIKVSWWRGVGPTHNVFVVESFLDECAHQAGRDPVEYRRALLGKNPRARAVLEKVADRSGWGGPLPDRCGRGVCVHGAFGSWSALVAEVEVTAVGEVKLRKLTAAIDCGIAINPNSVAAQVEGGVLFGLSAALYSGITFEGGVPQQSNFHDYRMLRINETPPFEAHVMKSDKDPGGVGETGTVSAAPALANAIFAATGVRLRKLPIDRSLLTQSSGAKQVTAGVAVPLGLAAAAAVRLARREDQA